MIAVAIHLEETDLVCTFVVLIVLLFLATIVRNCLTPHPCMNYNWAQRKCRQFIDLQEKARAAKRHHDFEEACRIYGKADEIKKALLSYGWEMVQDKNALIVQKVEK